PPTRSSNRPLPTPHPLPASVPTLIVAPAARLSAPPSRFSKRGVRETAIVLAAVVVVVVVVSLVSDDRSAPAAAAAPREPAPSVAAAARVPASISAPAPKVVAVGSAPTEVRPPPGPTIASAPTQAVVGTANEIHIRITTTPADATVILDGQRLAH